MYTAMYRVYRRVAFCVKYFDALMRVRGWRRKELFGSHEKDLRPYQ